MYLLLYTKSETRQASFETSTSSNVEGRRCTRPSWLIDSEAITVQMRQQDPDRLAESIQLFIENNFWLHGSVEYLDSDGDFVKLENKESYLAAVCDIMSNGDDVMITVVDGSYKYGNDFNQANTDLLLPLPLETEPVEEHPSAEEQEIVILSPCPFSEWHNRATDSAEDTKNRENIEETLLKSVMDKVRDEIRSEVANQLDKRLRSELASQLDERLRSEVASQLDERLSVTSVSSIDKWAVPSAPPEEEPRRESRQDGKSVQNLVDNAEELIKLSESYINNIDSEVDIGQNIQYETGGNLNLHSYSDAAIVDEHLRSLISSEMLRHKPSETHLVSSQEVIGKREGKESERSKGTESGNADGKYGEGREQIQRSEGEKGTDTKQIEQLMVPAECVPFHGNVGDDSAIGVEYPSENENASKISKVPFVSPEEDSSFIVEGSMYTTSGSVAAQNMVWKNWTSGDCDSLRISQYRTDEDTDNDSDIVENEKRGEGLEENGVSERFKRAEELQNLDSQNEENQEGNALLLSSIEEQKPKNEKVEIVDGVKRDSFEIVSQKDSENNSKPPESYEQQDQKTAADSEQDSETPSDPVMMYGSENSSFICLSPGCDFSINAPASTATVNDPSKLFNHDPSHTLIRPGVGVRPENLQSFLLAEQQKKLSNSAILNAQLSPVVFSQQYGISTHDQSMGQSQLHEQTDHGLVKGQGRADGSEGVWAAELESEGEVALMSAIDGERGAFSKQWTVKNCGTVKWHNVSLELKSRSSNLEPVYRSICYPNSLSIGRTMDIVVWMSAPLQLGDNELCRAVWRLAKPISTSPSENQNPESEAALSEEIKHPHSVKRRFFGPHFVFQLGDSDESITSDFSILNTISDSDGGESDGGGSTVLDSEFDVVDNESVSVLESNDV